MGIRGNSGAFTSIEALSPREAKTKVIFDVADGARWKTTIVLVNTDTVPAQFTVNFWKDDGSPFLPQVTDAIPVGGARTIETDGLGGSAVSAIESAARRSSGTRLCGRKRPFRCSRAADQARVAVRQGLRPGCRPGQRQPGAGREYYQDAA